MLHSLIEAVFIWHAEARFRRPHAHHTEACRVYQIGGAASSGAARPHGLRGDRRRRRTHPLRRM